MGCTKSKDRYTVRRSCLFRSSVFATICPHKNPPNFRHFDDIVLNLRIHSKQNFFFFSHQLLLVCLLFCFLLLLLSVYFLAPDENNSLSKTLAFNCFLVFRRICEYIPLDLFYQFCQPHQYFLQKKSVFFHIHEITRVVGLYTSLRLVEGVYKPQRACVG